MPGIPLENWEAFEEKTKDLFDNVKAKSTPLFRGQRNATWCLDTTLERFTDQEHTMHHYHDHMKSILPAVQSFTGKSWHIGEEFKKFPKDYKRAPQGLEFMVYLRHHGFPAPILDWTRSPYIAAFFAFRNSESSEDKRVAIYYFAEGKGGRTESPRIVRMGPRMTTHSRHHTQQCEYTYCEKKTDNPDNPWVYCNHKETFSQNDPDQGILTKYTLPNSERLEVLKKLDIMNINAYSLFGSEESLMETLAYRKITNPPY
ncbi:MAG: FRG domain-containing protein [bacterium]|nr:FRG domain-containing protein [bacterium]